SEKPALGSRCGSRTGGLPSQELPPSAALPGSDGGTVRTPSSEFSPIVVPAGTTALLPRHVRLPTFVGAMVIHPFSTREGPSATSSAIVAPSSMVSRSGVGGFAVERSTLRPSFAPRAWYHGARQMVAGS